VSGLRTIRPGQPLADASAFVGTNPVQLPQRDFGARHPSGPGQAGVSLCPGRRLLGLIKSLAPCRDCLGEKCKGTATRLCRGSFDRRLEGSRWGGGPRYGRRLAMLPGQFPQQFPQRFAPLLHRQHLCDVTRNRTRFPGTDFLVDPRDLIPRKTDRNLRPVHTGIIPRGASSNGGIRGPWSARSILRATPRPHDTNRP